MSPSRLDVCYAAAFHSPLSKGVNSAHESPSQEGPGSCIGTCWFCMRGGKALGWWLAGGNRGPQGGACLEVRPALICCPHFSVEAVSLRVTISRQRK